MLFAGGINIERGLQYVIPALRQLKQQIPNIKLQIIGKGSYLQTLKEIAEQYQVEYQIEFIGWKPLPELMEITAKADIALIPHIKWEQTDCSSPNKLFQYMHAGVPLLVSNCDSVARIVNETKCGESYPYDQIDAFVEKVLLALSNQKLYQDLQNNSYELALKKYNWKNISEELEQVYKNVKKNDENRN